MLKVMVYQPGRFGDILFTIPIARRLKEKGYDAHFMIKGQYKQLMPHFPDINFHEFENDEPMYDHISIEPCIFLPLWHGATFFKGDKNHKKEIMSDKYAMYNIVMKDNLDINAYWRNLTFKRFPEKEDKLFKSLGLQEGEKYVLVNGVHSKGKSSFSVKTDLKKVEFTINKEFTLLDWSKVIECAEEIHTVHTSLLYLIEVLNTTKKLHVYDRISGNVPVMHLMSKKYKEHQNDKRN